ncbi:hypothetical protein A2W67_00880 [Candidatus Nomurabacteria bacterium RIFCSPLOWO2_02_40_28]|uniref:Uncharacterized protein n=2 Tax=Candidatus Nomuraibacteriota TaxID=1752729 RepID=A0A837HRU0_9BACT|nr:MAG: hypothetical protein UT27_C0001G0003 [Candidatus Nomurabacteria bacterium GW2011_GWD2_39_12]KKR20730.1 MAG: hypothetical protein UT51_C0002G0165 [Candidatus Nomurabacteria bacterium GW2011_GWC2_39_41]KKR37342.1 MAG: hypothetical protein UT70_C0001G0018 [Candidatus Nomurabacteria bacterium GW2011_GWE2_40_10]KKR38589.1 MAG: hypothetical protein UT73_C0002G0074 [Candidatus Nomurabacteria bacterium GW2011_GWB1_40_11]KKR40314.1 MAG: hypothetical protein UT74_C0001G0048 [Parcubacteria group b
MSQKQLLFLQAIASFFAGGSLLCLIILFFHLFPSFLSSYSSISYGPWLEEGLKFGTALLLIRIAYLTPSTIPFVSIGFGFMEGIYHLMAYGKASIVPFWVHVILGLVMAYFFYLATNPKYLSFKSIWYSFALLIPVYLHLLYNIIVKA